MNAAFRPFATQILVTLALLAIPAVAQPTGASLVLENAQIVDPLSRTIRYGTGETP